MKALGRLRQSYFVLVEPRVSMHPDTMVVAEHMREFGLHVLGRAVFDSTFNEMMRPYAHAMAIGHAAHGAEIIIKARIAQEHPLLIFETLPKSRTTPGPLTVAELFAHGRTIMFSDLPERLWAATGIRMQFVDRFLAFGLLRNKIIHFAVPDDADLTTEALKFVFEVMEPLVNECWGESIADYAEQWDEAIITDGYLEEQLTERKIDITQRLREVLKGES